jgi:two-component system sensor histidine kinase CpxA
LFQGYGPPRLEGSFAVWLFIIGFIIAILIVPVSRLITKRVKQLRESALRIAEGDLSHRVGIRSRDEIGELASAFNLMTDKVESMLMSSKELNANVSHELRTPLARIRISEEMIRDKLKGGNITAITRHMDNISEDIDELDSLIGKILELSKLDLHESPLKLEPLDPAALMRDVIDRFKPLLENKGIKMETDLSASKKIYGDREALYTAFKNIMDNAAKFTHQYGTILVGMTEDDGCLKVRIQNPCERLKEEDLTKIFVPFHRTDRPKYEGSGLGLTITKKIVERHGGKIGAFNLDMGLEIRIDLPLDASSNSG